MLTSTKRRLQFLRRRFVAERLEHRRLLANDVSISEFMAINTASLTDLDGAPSAWIELWNNSDEVRDLSAWSLTNDSDHDLSWRIPDGVTLGSGQFLTVFASGKDRRQEELHTDFELQEMNGYLALLDQTDRVVHEFREYPQQFADVSFGISMPDVPADTKYTLYPEYDTWLRESAPDRSWENDAMWIAHPDVFQERRWGVAEWQLSGVEQEIVSARMEFSPRTRADFGATQVAYLIDHGIADLTWNDYQSLKQPSEKPLSTLGMLVIPDTEVTFDDYLSGIYATATDLDLLNQLRTSTGKFTVSFKSTAGAMEWNDGSNRGGGGFARDLPIRLVVESQSDFRPLEVQNDRMEYFVGESPGDFNGVGETDLNAGIFITEFMAANDDTLRDDDGDSADWIELYNGTRESISLDDWHLTDDRSALGKWSFPTGTRMAPGEFLIVFASGKNRRSVGGELHTNFRLRRSGEYLALTDGKQSVVHEYVFSEQYQDVSFGVGFPNGIGESRLSIPLNVNRTGFFVEPSPGRAALTVLVDGFVAPPEFSHQRGFYDLPDVFDLKLATATEAANIYYTFDGTVPSPKNSMAYEFSTHQAIPIKHTTTVRAAAFRDQFQASPTVTHTYLFPDDVVMQGHDKNPPTGWPDGPINGQRFDYGMDSEIRADAQWGAELRDAVTSLSTISIVTDLENLMDPARGIYVNASGQGRNWERPASVELIHPNGDIGFQIDAGIRPRGNFSASGSNPKHAFRLFFREEYGENWLNYPLFAEDGAARFRKLDLRTAQNDSWAFQASEQLTFVHDVFSRDNQAAMGQPHTRSRYHHLYINGQYWGLYQSQERAEANFGATYFGGDADNFDTIKSTGGPEYQTEVTDGALDAWERLWLALRKGVESNVDYMRLQGRNVDGTLNPNDPVLLDVDNLIDYMIDIFFTGDEDRGLSVPLGNNRPNNFFALRDRTGRRGFQFFSQDAEQSMLSMHNVGGLQANRLGPFSGSNRSSLTYANPQWMHQDLMANEHYRWQFQDRVHELFFNGGLFTAEAAIERFNRRAEEIETAIVAESARWGDSHGSRRNNPLTKADWERAISRMVHQFLARRPEIVLQQFRNAQRESTDGLVSAPLYPHLNAPVYSQHGGRVVPGFRLEINDPGVLSYVDTVLVSEASQARYLVPANNDLGRRWVSPKFDDSTWQTGFAGVGFERRKGGRIDYTDHLRTDLGPQMHDLHSSVYTRIEFDVDDPDSIGQLILKMKYDDAFIAFVDGVEVARSDSAPHGIPLIDTRPSSHADSRAIVFEEFHLGHIIKRLSAGRHVLAIHGMNVTRSSNDMLLVPELVSRNQRSTPSGGQLVYTIDGSDPRQYDPKTGSVRVAPSAVKARVTDVVALHQSLTVKARVYFEGEWSALNQARFNVLPAEATWDPDFNQDQRIDVLDIDRLLVAVRQRQMRFDLNRDAMVDRRDVGIYVAQVFGSWIGDANLDGSFDSQDIVQIFESNEYDDGISRNSTWEDGDWNGDGEFDSDDLVWAFLEGGYRSGS